MWFLWIKESWAAFMITFYTVVLLKSHCVVIIQQKLLLQRWIAKEVRVRVQTQTVWKNGTPHSFEWDRCVDATGVSVHRAPIKKTFKLCHFLTFVWTFELKWKRKGHSYSVTLCATTFPLKVFVLLNRGVKQSDVQSPYLPVVLSRLLSHVSSENSVMIMTTVCDTFHLITDNQCFN